jgi:ribA/ribD-fused uncharacterized protein
LDTYADLAASGVEYSCAEQYMMAKKAELFGDELSLRLILAATEPSEHKKLGRAVKNFDSAVWEAACEGIVRDGNYAKFTQNADMLQQLLATDSKLLVEASPLDKVWGIGMRADHPHATDTIEWKGSNKLGTALMAVRDRIRREQAEQQHAAVAAEAAPAAVAADESSRRSSSSSSSSSNSLSKSGHSSSGVAESTSLHMPSWQTDDASTRKTGKRHFR